MISLQCLVFCVIGVEVILTHAQEFDAVLTDKNLLQNASNLIKTEDNIKDSIYKLRTEEETVKIQVFYESMCPFCRDFLSNNLKPTVEKLSQYFDIHLNPYGNANTTVNNGNYEFTCQHGPEECYGNKLHACAIDFLRNATKSVFFNACIMEFSQKAKGSDDAAVDTCGKSMQIESENIKECAKDEKGNNLLKNYGDESKKVNFKYVPYILINGVLNNNDDFTRDVCAAFNNPPPQCKHSN